MKRIAEENDNVDLVFHQGKTLDQWEKAFDGMFTKDQLLKIIRGGADLEKMLTFGLDEAEEAYVNPDPLADEGLMESTSMSIKDYIMPNCQLRFLDDNGNELYWIFLQPDDIDWLKPYLETRRIDDSFYGLLPRDVARRFMGKNVKTALFIDGEEVDPARFDETIAKVHERIALVRQHSLEAKGLKSSLELESSAEDEAAALGLNESFGNEVVTVGDFFSTVNKSMAKKNDKIMFRVKKQAYAVVDVHAKNGICVVDLAPAIANANTLNESDITDEQWNEAFKWFEANGYHVHDSDEGGFTFSEPVNGKQFYPEKEGYELYLKLSRLNEDEAAPLYIKTTGDLAEYIDAQSPDKRVTFKIRNNFFDAYNIKNIGNVCAIEISPVNKQSPIYSDLMNDMRGNGMNEGYNWRNGGYGGTGRSYRSFGEFGAPKGKEISWFDVSQLDPKARGKMQGWRVGPSNFPFKDLLYPERKYKVGTTVLRSKFLKAGDESGVKYIAVPSYLDAIRNNDEAAIELLKTLGIPLDLTFGYGPEEDFSSTYTIAS